MGFFDGFAEALAAAVDDIRHNVVEIPAYGREVTGNIELREPAQAVTSEEPAQHSKPSHNDLYFVQQPPQDMER